ncbi:tyrosine-type recombinase/integrase [Altererythrobacter sp. MF3-039]|uniref:tyrosine-type recombinase/integrase n=1 Tax=Altererythrobacter sp. MF3-039 TaxID=3252901 RepID=UPI00390C5987
MPKLTALKVKHAKPGRHGDGEGLYLLVSKTGAKSWMVRVMARNPENEWKRRDIGLGSAADYSLEEARERARETRKIARTGQDPTVVRDKVEDIAPTFKVASHACHEAKAPGWSEKNAAAFLSSLALHVFPKIGGLSVDTITERDVAAVLSPIWQSKPALAKKVRARVGLILDYAKAQGWRSEGAPRQSLSALLSKQPEGGQFASMPYEELPAYVAKVLAETETMGRLSLLFTILTACRNGEARAARWSQIDFDKNLWNRPASMMGKTGQPHSITLSPEAIDILERAKDWRTNPKDCLIFYGKGGKRLSDMTIGKVVRSTGYHTHGFRSTFKTWAVECVPNIPEAVSEVALAHTIPSQVERAYNRAKFLDMRRTLLDAWGRYVTGTSSDIVQLPLLRA